MANFFTRALDKITPWNRGGEVQRNQQSAARKKKKEEEQPSQAPVARSKQPSQQSQPFDLGIQPIQPVNVFDANKNLMLGQNKPGIVPVFKTTDVQSTPQPQPGTIVQPNKPKTAEDEVNSRLDAGKSWEQISRETNVPLKDVQEYSQSTRPNYGITVAKPRQTAPNKFRDIFDANTDADKFRRQEINKRTVLQPGQKEIPINYKNPVVGFVKRNLSPTGLFNVGKEIVQGAARFPIETTQTIEQIGRAAKEADRQKAAGYPEGLTAAQKDELARAAAPSKTFQASGWQKRIFGDAPVKSLREQSKDLSTLVEQKTGKKPSVVALTLAMLGLNTIPSAVNEVRGARKGVEEGLNALTKNIDNAAEVAARPKVIPVKQNIPVSEVVTDNLDIPVAVNSRPKPQGPIIRELGGDAKSATQDSVVAKRVADIRETEAAAANNVPIDKRIEGVTPRAPEKPFVLNEKTVAQGQGDIVDQYATMLRDVGEGNGTQVVPDGNGGYMRTSNNYRTGETAGKKMTKAEWRNEAQRQLDTGRAEPSVQKAFDEANNPETQSLLAKGEQPDVPTGRPIEIKQVKGIDVVDQTNVPQNLPETPGQVRVTEQASPMAARSEAVATQTPPVAPRESVPSDVTPTAKPVETLPTLNESDATFLKRQAQNMQSNIKRAVESLKSTKKITKKERAQRAAAGQKAYEEARAAGLSTEAQDAARKNAMKGSFDRQDYAGIPIHSADEQRLRDMVDAHYSDMPYQAGNVRDAFTKLFHSGEPGHWASETGNHITPSDIKNIRKFLNESVPNVDGNGGLGDFAEAAIKELADAEPGPGKIANAIGLQRALRFTADISATGRQVLPAALSHPVEFAKAAKKSFEVMFSHKKYQKFVSEMVNSKEANYINDRLGAYISVMNDDISKADDIYRNSSWAHKIPGVNQVVAASERQYNTLLSMMRYNEGKRYIDAAGGIGGLEKAASDSGNPEEFLKAIGTVTNINTGRGLNGKMDSATAKVLSNVLVSPRGLAARLQRFNPKYYIDLMSANPAAGKEALRSLGIQTAVTVSALAAANAAGLYEDGQIKVGNTRYDVTGGAANMIRTAVRVAQYVHGDRETTPFNTAETEVTRWARNQLAPFLASSLDAIGIHQDPKSGTWVNRWGEDVTLGSTVLDNIAPVNASQIASDRNLGTSGGQTVANAALNTFGIGVNTYESTTDKNLPKGKSARDIYKQLQKDGIGTSSTDLSGYIADGNYDVANRVAEYNLMALKDNPKSSQSQIKKAEQTINEIQLRQNGVPMTDDGITAKMEDGDWDKAIQGYQFKIDKAKRDGEISQKTEKGIKNDITRAEVARDNAIDPALLSSYKSTSLADWRKMGTPPGDKNYDEDMYDPEMYQKLWDIDQKMSKKGVSYNAKALDKPKYSAKEAKGSGGGRGSNSIDTSFGTLKGGYSTPKVQQYDTIDAKSGNVPRIGIVRPNIVHKISSSG